MESRGRRYVEQVAETFIERLKEGTAPWLKPWAPGEGPDLPVNAVTGKPYRGMNSLYLSMVSPNDDPRWCTMKQANGLGGRVRKGEHGQLVRFWKFRDRQLVRDEGGAPVLDADGKRQYREVELERPKAFHAFVFHASQIDGLEAYRRPPAPERAWEPSEKVQELIDAAGVAVHHDQRDRPFYSPSTDDIHLPQQGQFATKEAYYATALHELGHATGHETRLNRQFGTYGDPEYAREELRAEIASYMLGTELGVGHDGSQSAACVGSWIEKLEEDPQEVYAACRDADRIVWFLREQTREREQTVEQSQRRAGAEVAKGAERTALVVPFADNKEVKALGGKWDRKARQWFVAKGTDLGPFAKWLPGPERAAPAGPARSAESEKGGADLAESKTRLAVPYAEKDEAKRLGAKWDGQGRVWFAPEGTDLAPLRKWVATERGAPASQDVVADFGAFLEEVGLVLDGPPVMDGARHRVPVEGGRPGATDGAYQGYLDGRPAGYAKNWKTGEEKTWSARMAVSQEQVEALRAEVAERRAERRAETEAAYQEAAGLAAERFADMIPATTDHPYLAAKGLDAVSEGLVSFGAREDEKGNLVVPLADGEGRVWTLQSISDTGFKHLMKGGRMGGCFHVIGQLKGENVRRPDREDPTVPREYPDPDAELREVWVTTGFGTGAVVHAATGQPVVCAISDANLHQVAVAMSERFPDHRVVVLGDDDRHLPEEDPPKANSGREKAQSAAEAANGIAVFPTFMRNETGRDYTDFADVARARAEEAGRESGGEAFWPGGFHQVRRQIEQAIGRALAREAEGQEATRGGQGWSGAEVPDEMHDIAPPKEAQMDVPGDELVARGAEDPPHYRPNYGPAWASALKGYPHGRTADGMVYVVIDGKPIVDDDVGDLLDVVAMHEDGLRGRSPDGASQKEVDLGNDRGREGAARQEARRPSGRGAEATRENARPLRRLGGGRARDGLGL